MYTAIPNIMYQISMITRKLVIYLRVLPIRNTKKAVPLNKLNQYNNLPQRKQTETDARCLYKTSVCSDWVKFIIKMTKLSVM